MTDQDLEIRVSETNDRIYIPIPITEKALSRIQTMQSSTKRLQESDVVIYEAAFPFYMVNWNNELILLRSKVESAKRCDIGHIRGRKVYYNKPGAAKDPDYKPPIGYFSDGPQFLHYFFEDGTVEANAFSCLIDALKSGRYSKMLQDALTKHKESLQPIPVYGNKLIL